MSLYDWEQLKNKCKSEFGNDFRWPKRYTSHTYSFSEVHYTAILSDMFNKTKFNEWYFDDDELVQVDRTIVHVTPNMTFKEMITKVLNSDKLEIV